MVSSTLIAANSNTQSLLKKPQRLEKPEHCDETRCDDLTQLGTLNQDAVLQALFERYKKGVYYTWAGITLLAVNPFQSVPELYAENAVDLYSCHEADLITKNIAFPHVFQVGHKAFTDMKRGLGTSKQSIIVSGESGAGKTWTARCLMQFITQLTQNQSSVSPMRNHQMVKKIEQQILDSNPVLEAFGNAGTTRNDNSSRFGKYIQIQFNRNHEIIGARIRTYLLEKTRAAHQAQGERNFHIFYQMLADPSETEKISWMLPNSENSMTFTCLPKYDKKFPGYAKQAFCVTKAALASIGVDHDVQGQVFQVLASVLHLGNIIFQGAENVQTYNAGSVCLLLGLSEESLSRCLLYQCIRASGGNEQFMKPCSEQECRTRRDCLSKLIYSRIFDWLVEFINQSIQAPENKTHSFIGLLDVYGFESFSSNGLEQLCINYANEKLQQHFVFHFLKKQQSDYEKECIAWSHVDFKDNRLCLDLLDGRLSVFSLLNEECRLKRSTDACSLAGRIHSTLGNSQHLSELKRSVVPSFIITHYAGEVCYQTDQLIEKNKDLIPDEILDLLISSNNPFVSSLFSCFQVATDVKTGSRINSSRTVVTKFKSSLEKLMSTLKATSPHYIRCIKPNPECSPAVFNNKHVLQQLVACGVVETIQISAAGYPVRLTYTDFLKRYGFVMKYLKPETTQTQEPQTHVLPSVAVNQQIDRIKQNRRRSRQRRRSGESSSDHTRQICTALVTGVLGRGEDKENTCQGGEEGKVLMGRTKMFFKEAQVDKLEFMRQQCLSSCAFSIQCYWRKCLRIKKRKYLAATSIQAGFRGWKARLCILKWHLAAAVVQKAFRQYLSRKRETKRQEEMEKTRREIEERKLNELNNETANENSISTKLEYSSLSYSSSENKTRDIKFSLSCDLSCVPTRSLNHEFKLMAEMSHDLRLYSSWLSPFSYEFYQSSQRDGSFCYNCCTISNSWSVTSVMSSYKRRLPLIAFLKLLVCSSTHTGWWRSTKRISAMNRNPNICRHIASVRQIHKEPIVFHCRKSPLASADVLPCTVQVTSRGLIEVLNE